MKTRIKFIGIMAVAAAVCLMASSARADRGWGGGRGWGWGVRGWGWGWPAGVSVYYGAPYYYYPYNYYYAAPPAYYSTPAPAVVYSVPAGVPSYQPTPSQPAGDVSQRPVADRPLPPTAAVNDAGPQSSPIQTPRPVVRPAPASQAIGLADVKALAKAQLSDAIIISQIRNSQAVFHLTSDQIIDLKTSGVSEKVIDVMVNTAGDNR